MGEQTALYHPIHGGHVFDSDNLPDPRHGWFDSHKKVPTDPEKFDRAWKVPFEIACKPAPKTAKQKAKDAERTSDPALPDPAAFDSLEAYLTEFRERLAGDLTTDQVAEQISRAEQHYAAVRAAMGAE